MPGTFDIHRYDYYLVMFSGGKDSTACFLHLLDMEIPLHKIELWHQLIDGQGPHFMDWECTPDYCRKFAAAFGVPIYFSWKDGGFKAEMLRKNKSTKPNYFETPSGTFYSGGKGKPNTRLQFPQLSADLSVRWCSPYLKIMVAQAAIVNQARFYGKRLLVISGERAEESPNRKHYAFFEPDGTDNRNGKYKRHVDRCRLIHSWNEAAVWNIIQRYCVLVHPCYFLGYNRCSCKWCIFCNNDQIATSYYLSPAQGKTLAKYERKFGKTIKHGIDLMTYIKRGIPYKAVFLYPDIAIQAITPEYTMPIFTNNWRLPAGAFKKGNCPA